MNNRKAKSVDPDEMDCYKPFFLDMHCLQRILYWLTLKEPFKVVADNILKLLFFPFFQENDAWHCLADDSHNLPSLIFLKKNNNKRFRMSSSTILLSTLTLKVPSKICNR